MNSQTSNYNPLLDEAAHAILVDDRELLRAGLDPVFDQTQDIAAAWLFKAWSCECLNEIKSALQQVLKIDSKNDTALAGLGWVKGIQEIARLQLVAKELADKAESVRIAELERARAEEEARLQAKEEERLRVEEVARIQAEQRCAEDALRARAAEQARLDAEERDRILAERKLAEEAQRAQAQVAAERMAAERMAAERMAAERMAAERMAAERMAAERMAAERMAAERMAAEKARQKAEAEQLAELARLAELDDPDLIVEQPATQPDAYHHGPARSAFAAVVVEATEMNGSGQTCDALENEVKEAVEDLVAEIGQVVKPVPMEPTRNEPAATDQGPIGGVRSCVLAVDDSPTIRKLVSIALTQQGFDVITAEDGVDALSIIAKSMPDLILSDINMPKLGGYKLCKFVKKHERTRHIPFILLSGNDGVFDKIRGKMSGCNGFLAKPFESKELVDTVRQHLSNVTG